MRWRVPPPCSCLRCLGLPLATSGSSSIGYLYYIVYAFMGMCVRVSPAVATGATQEEVLL